MTVKDYYYSHFGELSPEKQFHFATRMKNYFKCQDFDKYLSEHRPSTDLSSIISDNDYSKVNNANLRKPFFEKYEGLYGLEAALFRIHHLNVEYNIDIRESLLEIYSLEGLYKLSDDLLRDDDALRILSTWAVNTICLIEELFPRGKNVVNELSREALDFETEGTDPTLLAYFYTHIIICESGFYTKDLKKSRNSAVLKKVLKRCADLISNNLDILSLDACVEFLVCSNMIDMNYPKLRAEIAKICRQLRGDSPYLINYRRDNTPGNYFHTLDGAEHINALYIMSGLDV